MNPNIQKALEYAKTIKDALARGAGKVADKLEEKMRVQDNMQNISSNRAAVNSGWKGGVEEWGRMMKDKGEEIPKPISQDLAQSVFKVYKQVRKK